MDRVTPAPVSPSGAAASPALDPQLAALTAAFDAGDFARVREDAPRLVASSPDDAVKRAAETLLARTRPDPLAVLLLAITALLLVVLSAWWLAHDNARGAAP